MTWLAYGGIINLVAVLLTAWDKRCARHGRRRVRESTLWTVAALGGSPGMLVTMHLVRHKTRHCSFMLGLPLLLIAQSAIVTFFTFYY